MMQRKMNNEKNPIVDPHKKLSRQVEETDINRVYDDAMQMYKIFGKKIGMYNTFLAVAHQQFTKNDPLKFFVLNPNVDMFKDMPEAIIVNAEIIRHTNNTVDSEEGCLSFSTLPPTIVQRWNKCEVRFQVLLETKQLSGWQTMNLSGMAAKVFQHEIDHQNCKYIYDFE